MAHFWPILVPFAPKTLKLDFSLKCNSAQKLQNEGFPKKTIKSSFKSLWKFNFMQKLRNVPHITL